MKKGLYAGSFDPLTKAHEDIIKRALNLFDEVIVLVAYHPDKTACFSPSQRVDLIKRVFDKNLAPVDRRRLHVQAVVQSLTAKVADSLGATFLIRGIRSQADFLLEEQLNYWNKQLVNHLDTVLFISDEGYRHVSSSRVKELASYGEIATNFLDPLVAKAVAQKYKLNGDKPWS